MDEAKKELTLDELTNISKDLTNMYDVHVDGFPFILQLGNFNIFIDQQDKDEEIAFVSIDGLNVIFVPLAKVVKIYQTCENETIILELEDNKRILLLKIPTDQSASIIDESYRIEKYKHKSKKNQLKYKSKLKKLKEFTEKYPHTINTIINILFVIVDVAVVTYSRKSKTNSQN